LRIASGEVKEAETRAMLGVIDQAYLLPVLEALAAQDGPRMMHEAAELAARGFSFDAALQDPWRLCCIRSPSRKACRKRSMKTRRNATACSSWPARFDPESVQLHYQIATLGRRDLEWAPDEYAGFSMTLLRMLAFATTGATRPPPACSACPRARPASAASAKPVRPPPAAMRSNATAASTSSRRR
ncbi:MAG: hypothetical protein U5K75_02045, partial [Ahrensia sp.]|nr:hypothetical protein [Ahrensia sp.]